VRFSATLDAGQQPPGRSFGRSFHRAAKMEIQFLSAMSTKGVYTHFTKITKSPTYLLCSRSC
jgi:hypothetical protein